MYHIMTEIHHRHGHKGRDNFYNIVKTESASITKDFCNSFVNVCCPEAAHWKNGGKVDRHWLPERESVEKRVGFTKEMRIRMIERNGTRTPAHNEPHQPVLNGPLQHPFNESLQHRFNNPLQPAFDEPIQWINVGPAELRATGVLPLAGLQAWGPNTLNPFHNGYSLAGGNPLLGTLYTFGPNHPTSITERIIG